MQVFGSMPPYANGGSCVVTRRSRVEPGERVLCLDVDVESLQPWGMLCVNSSAVKLMVNELGWTLLDDDGERKRAQERRRLTALREENKVLRAALAHIADAAKSIGIEHLLTEAEAPEELVPS